MPPGIQFPTPWRKKFPAQILSRTYTLDGNTWQRLGQVNMDNWLNKEFVIPNETITNWESVQNIQIGIKSLSSTGDAPTIYLDGMTLSVRYEEVPQIEPEEPPVAPIIPKTGYSRFPAGEEVSSPVVIDFSFEDWEGEMDFVDIFGSRQNYWIYR